MSSAQDTLARELRWAEEWSQPVQGEEGTDIYKGFYKGMTTVFFNENGVPRRVQGANEMLKIIQKEVNIWEPKPMQTTVSSTAQKINVDFEKAMARMSTIVGRSYGSNKTKKG